MIKVFGSTWGGDRTRVFHKVISQLYPWTRALTLSYLLHFSVEFSSTATLFIECVSYSRIQYFCTSYGLRMLMPLTPGVNPLKIFMSSEEVMTKTTLV